MQNHLIQKIIKEKISCYFVSPHFDDAILSSGDLISFLSSKTNVVVVNVFTKAGEYNTFSAKKFVKDSGFRNANLLFKARNKEDQKAFSKFPVTRINLDFKDALWRNAGVSKKRKFLGRFVPEIGVTYPTYRIHIKRGKVAKIDDQTISKLAQKLRKIVKEENAIVFCPLGIGDHVDHLITKEACKQLDNKQILWVDFPYSIRCNLNEKFWEKPHEGFTFINNPELKSNLIKSYETQFTGLFSKEGFKLVKEKFVVVPVKTKIQKIKKPSEKFFSEWKKLWKNSPRGNTFNSPEWFKANIKTFEPKNYCIYLLKSRGKIKAILPLVQTKLYGVDVWQDPGGEHVDKSSLLITGQDLTGITDFIKQVSVGKNLFLRELPEHLKKFLKSTGNVTFEPTTSPFLYLGKDPHRYLIKEQINKIKNILKKHGRYLRFETYSGNFEKTKRIVEEVDKLSSKHQKGYNVFSESKFFLLIHNLAKINPKSVVTDILWYQKTPITYSVGFVYKDTFLAYQTAFKSEYSKLAPGKILLWKMASKKRNNIKLIDLGTGENAIKNYFTPLKSLQYSFLFTKNNFDLLVLKTFFQTQEYLKNNKTFYKTYCLVRKYSTKLKIVNSLGSLDAKIKILPEHK